VKVIWFLTLFVLGWSSVLTVNVSAPKYEFQDNHLVVSDASHINLIGAPDVPSMNVRIALPPGAMVQTVNFHGLRHEIGTALILPAQPPLPLMHGDAAIELQKRFEKSYEMYYESDNVYPSEHGKILSTGGLRKYTLVTVACYHFAYNPRSKIVYYAPNITVEVHYEMPDPLGGRARYWQGLIDDITFDYRAQELIYNWDEAQAWYQTDSPQRANGYYIIIPSAIQNAADALAQHRQGQGYDVHIVTKEYIEANIVGDDMPQKFRNYLRANMLDIGYALLVGFSADMPWRNLVPFNDDPDSPWDDLDYSPIPSDLYLAELTDPDSLSWNSDGDTYYGEVYDANFLPNGDDDPDYHADIHLGRIPYSTQNIIEDICTKLIAFDTDTDVSYKTASLLTGALYYYANENYSGNARMDGADYCEQLLIDSILPRTTATTLYEKGGLAPCTLACTDSLTRSNHIAYWQNKGVMYECHHGNVTLYARKLWAWDDGDNVPETPEITWPPSLMSSDVYQLDNDHPATCFLRSCLCGKPEQTGLGAALLYRGASSVISSSRISWGSNVDPGGIPYHFYERLLQDTTMSNGIIGNSYDIARNDFMDNTMFWIPAYHYNLFGDPALRQFGQLVSVEEDRIQKPAPQLSVFPNPSRGILTIVLHSSLGKKAKFDIYDVSGRLVKSMQIDSSESENASLNMRLPAGVYFVTGSDGDNVFQRKIVITK